MLVTQRSDGKDVASAVWEGRGFMAVSRNGATMKLARRLVEAGCPDGPWQACGAEGVRFHGPSLHGLAKWTIWEGDGPMRLARYVEKPRFPARDATQDGAEPLPASAEASE